LFIVFRKNEVEYVRQNRTAPKRGGILFSNQWEVQFAKNDKGNKTTAIFDSLKSWSLAADNEIAYYSGTAIYRNKFNVDQLGKDRNVYINSILSAISPP